MASTHFSDSNSKRGPRQSQAPKFDWPKLRQAIKFFEKQGVCYLPAGWGRKNPALDSWEEYQTRLPTMVEKADWFHEGKATNIGVVCGGISRGLVVLAFNDPNGAREFFEEERWQKLPQVTFVTQATRGPHVWLRSNTPIKSQQVGKGRNASWLEIRSDGNYTIAPPSLHPSGVLYQAIGVDRIHKPNDLAGFIVKRLVELGLREPLRPKEPTHKRLARVHPPCLEIISQGVGGEQRHEAALALARHYLIQFYKPEEVLWLLQEWDTKNKPPLNDAFSLESRIRLAESYQGYFCSLIKDKPAVSAFCVGDEKCHWTKPKKEEEPLTRERPEWPKEFNELAVEKLLTNCFFMAYCADHATTLSEPSWWSECNIFSFFGEPGREKAHELSQPYPKYTREETDQKLEYAKEAKDKDIGPHSCAHIEKTLGFSCPEDCLAKKWKIKSPVGLARVLVKREKGSKYLIIKTNTKGEITSITVNNKALIDDLKHEFTFMSVFGLVRDDILVYENGVYTFNGEKLIREECETRVPPPSLTTHICHEIRDRIAGTTFADREKFNTEKYIVNLENGLLNVKTRELIPHTPAFLSTVRIPITYDPQAKCPRIQGFLGAILRQEDVKVILEFFGYILIPDYSIPVVLILLGEGSNGKTQLIRLLGLFIGRGNYVSVSLQDIENSPFAVASLQGKLLNMQGDLSSRWLSGVGMLKQLSGQDPLTANRKYRDPLQFDNFARLVFASNRPPKIEEDTLAVWRRILPIDLPNTFQGEKDIKNYIDTILTPQELSGLLNLALDGLQHLLNKGDFSYQGSYSDRSRQYTIASDPARAFVEERCDIGTECKILKEELYEAYAVFCDEHRVQLSGDSQFAKELRQVPGLSIRDKQYQEKGERVRWWLGIQLKGKEEEEELGESPTEQIDMDV